MVPFKSQGLFQKFVQNIINFIAQTGSQPCPASHATQHLRKEIKWRLEFSNGQHLRQEISQTRPLSQVMSEQIGQLRAWASGRTVAAG